LSIPLPVTMSVTLFNPSALLVFNPVTPVIEAVVAFVTVQHCISTRVLVAMLCSA
jgi:hypothetical protein